MDGFEIRGRRLRVSLVEPNASGGAPGMLFGYKLYDFTARVCMRNHIICGVGVCVRVCMFCKVYVCVHASVK